MKMKILYTAILFAWGCTRSPVESKQPHSVAQEIDWSGFLASHQEFRLLDFHPTTTSAEIVSAAQAAVKGATAEKNGLEIKILGAGPVGLLAAVEAALQGYRVQVWEKRITYSRSIWFDYYALPWSKAMSWLERLGFHQLGKQGEDWEMHEGEIAERVRTMRCQSLERFLSFLAVALGAELHYGESPTLEALDTDDTALILDASGAKSSIPTTCGVSKRPPTTLQWHQLGMDDIQVPLLEQDEGENAKKELSHLTWLASLSSCETMLPQYDPFYISTRWGLENVTSLFQRHFAGVCEVQALFRSSVDEEKARSTVTRILDYFNGTVTEEEIFPISIKVLDAAAVTSCSKAPVLFIGDSALNSYYRMGVGMHKAFFELDVFVEILQDFAATKQLDKALVGRLEHSQRFWAGYQQSVLALEAYCGLFVGFNLMADSMQNAATVYIRDEFGEYLDAAREDIVHCFRTLTPELLPRHYLPVKDEL